MCCVYVCIMALSSIRPLLTQSCVHSHPMPGVCMSAGACRDITQSETEHRGWSETDHLVLGPVTWTLRHIQTSSDPFSAFHLLQGTTPFVSSPWMGCWCSLSRKATPSAGSFLGSCSLARWSTTPELTASSLFLLHVSWKVIGKSQKASQWKVIHKNILYGGCIESVDSFSPIPSVPTCTAAIKYNRYLHYSYVTIILILFFKEMAIKCQKVSQRYLNMTLHTNTRSEEEMDQKATADVSIILHLLQDIIRATLIYLINIWLLRL